MKRIFSVSSTIAFIIFLLSVQTNFSSCTKDPVTDTVTVHDTTTIHDTTTVHDTTTIHDTTHVDSCASIVLQPANNIFETHLLGGNTKDLGDPLSPEFGADAWTINGETVYVRGLFRFDLSAVPAGKTIVSAKLSLYSDPTPLTGDLVHANSGTSNAFYIQRITSSWDNTITWSTQPSTTTDDQVLIPQTNDAYLDLIEIDVTSMAEKMHQANNYGFLIKLQNEVIYNSRIFCSSKFTDAAKHPKLVIRYM